MANGDPETKHILLALGVVRDVPTLTSFLSPPPCSTPVLSVCCALLPLFWVCVDLLCDGSVSVQLTCPLIPMAVTVGLDSTRLRHQGKGQD